MFSLVIAFSLIDQSVSFLSLNPYYPLSTSLLSIGSLLWKSLSFLALNENQFPTVLIPNLRLCLRRLLFEKISEKINFLSFNFLSLRVMTQKIDFFLSRKIKPFFDYFVNFSEKKFCLGFMFLLFLKDMSPFYIYTVKDIGFMFLDIYFV